jgi:hypothetical protein
MAGPRAPAQTEVNGASPGPPRGQRDRAETAADFEAAIREGGVAVDRNVRGLKAGVELVAAGPGDGEAPRPDRPWADVKAERAGGLGARGAAFLALAARAEAEFPEVLHPVLGEALARAGGLPGRALRGAVPRAGCGGVRSLARETGRGSSRAGSRGG